MARVSTARALIVLGLVLPAVASGQIQSITTSMNYAFVMSKRLNVQSASAVGGGAELRLRLYEDVSLCVSAAYSSYAIKQPDELNQWNWNFWNDRYYPKIQSDMRADPNLTAQIGSVQSMDAIPVMLSVIYGCAPGERLTITPRVGGGVSFFTRKLYADETWTKQFPQAAYTLTYNLRNFAPDKKGSVFLLAFGCGVAYRIAGDVNVTADVQYRKYVSASSGYAYFPFDDECLITLGLTFLY
jgi:hypothetical protein